MGLENLVSYSTIFGMMAIDLTKPDHLLMTKLYIPPVRPNLVLRFRLIERLDAGVRSGCKLLLISAPAGFGKTTLVSEWVAVCGLPVAWLSLDKGDNNLTHFLVYLVAALQTIVPTIGERVLAALQSPQPPPTESLLTALLNEIVVVPEHFILVLDDYHVIEALVVDTSPSVDDALIFLLDHLPPQMHLVIATRENPSLPLSRYRVRGQLTEVRAADLRFTPAEASEFLNRVMDLALAAEDVAALENRTEGWIAGLQLAALALQGIAKQDLILQGTVSMPGYEDASHFIESFTGSHHFVLDYLIEEVLNQQPESVQTFLLRTSILDRLCGSLCDAVLVNPEEAEPSLPAAAETSPLASQSILEYLESRNLFLVPLDNAQQYYRYHHLFSDMLRHRLRRSFPALLPHLHARAATWFEEQGNVPDAFDHWVAAGNYLKAAQVVEKYGYQYFEKADFQQLSHWLQSLPPELIHSRPWLCIFHSWGLIFTGQYEEAELHLALAEEKLGPISEISDPDHREQYGHLAASRAFLASRSQDGEGITHYVGLALKYVSPSKRAMRGYSAFFLGTGRYKENQYTLAQESWREAARLNKEAGNMMIVVNSLVALAELNRIQGKLHESFGVCQETARMAIDEWGKPLPVSAEVYVTRARLYYEWNDFASAEADFAKAAKLMKLYPSFDLKVEYNTWLSYLHLVQGHPALAAVLIHEIEESERQSFYKSAAAFLACRINYYLAVGDLVMVEHILNQQDWNLEDKNIFTWADPFFAYVRVLVYQKEFQRANDLLEACRVKLERYELWTLALKALILQACISYQQRERVIALEQVRRALTLAKPEGFVRLFVDEGLPMAQLLSEAAAHEMTPDYIPILLAAFGTENRGGQDISYRTSTVSAQPLVESLSPRELEILQLIAQGLSNREIAAQLFLALSTVKGHNSKIYDKLQVQRRTEAIARARELGLL